MGGGYVRGALDLVELFQAAGWNTVDSGVSTAVQVRSAFYLQVASDPGPGSPPPVDMTPAQCASSAGRLYRQATVGGVILSSYNPYLFNAGTCGGGSHWFEAGDTALLTASSLAGKITSGLVFSVLVTGTIGDLSAGGLIEFTLTSLATAFENDEVVIGVGGGDPVSTRGFYTLRSPTIDGTFLECKIETRRVNNSGGIFTYDGIGSVRICLTITASGGGEYYQPLMPGLYNFCGSHHQFAIWPRFGATPSRNANSSILASLVKAPDEHLIGGNCPLVIGSNNGDLNINYGQLNNQLHWPMSLACGQQSTMDDTGFRKGDGGPDGYRTVTMLVRGTKGRPTVSLAGQPLVQAPYVALPPNPNAGQEAQIVGKLWDMVITSGNATVGATMIHDGKKWTCISSTAPTGDVGCDLWIKTDAG